jgi:hypothetical protein
MALLAWSSIAAWIRANRSPTASSPSFFLPGQFQLLVFLMVSSTEPRLERRRADLAPAGQALASRR